MKFLRSPLVWIPFLAAILGTNQARTEAIYIRRSMTSQEQIAFMIMWAIILTAIYAAWRLLAFAYRKISSR